MSAQTTAPSPHPMRRHERQQPQEKGHELLKQAEWGVLSLIGADGVPYGVPLSFALDAKTAPADSTSSEGLFLPDIVFHAALVGRKLDCLAHESRAMFTVVGATEVLPDMFSTRYLSVMAFGRVLEIIDETEKKRLLMQLAAKYSPGHDMKAEAYTHSKLKKTCVLRFVTDSMSVKGRL